MLSSALYPICLNLSGMSILVAGFGSVGQRKVSGLLASGAKDILVLDIIPAAVLAGKAQDLVSGGLVRYENRRCAENDICSANLVFACTSSRAENMRIAALCRKAGILCNTATDPQEGSFIVPAVARRGPMLVALSTGGASPLLAARWRKELETWLADREKLAWFMGRLRELILGSCDHAGQAHEIFTSLINSPFPGLLQAGNMQACHSVASDILPCDLRQAFSGILKEYEDKFI